MNFVTGLVGLKQEQHLVKMELFCTDSRLIHNNKLYLLVCIKNVHLQVAEVVQ